LQNVCYIPQVKAQLVSFDQLEKSGLRIQLTKKPYKFIFTSPNGTICEAKRQDNEVFILQQYDGSSNGVTYAVGKLPENSEDSDGESKLKAQPPPGFSATKGHWHHRLSHMSRHDLQ